MTVVSDRKTSHFGGISVARNPGDALNDHEGMETVKNLSENVVKTLLKK